MNTEECFVLASLKEFVILWGSGSQASFNLECNNGQAWFRLSSLLGRPNHQHFSPPLYTQTQSEQPRRVRKKSPNQIARNNARAAAHRAAMNATKPAEKASLDSDDASKPAVENPSSTNPTAAVGDKDINDENDDLVIQEDHAVHYLSHAEAVSPAAATGFPPTPSPLSMPPPAEPDFINTITETGAFKHVNDEILNEKTEVKVRGTAVYENCPDQKLTDEYICSLRKFICSEKHLERNISDIQTFNFSSRSSGDRFVHTMSVDISVKTTNLWESAQNYIVKHVGKSDWLKANKTRITLRDIQEFKP